MKNILKIGLIAFLAVVFINNKAQAQEVKQDTSFTIILDSLRSVYIYADTGKALNRVDKMGRKQGLWEKKYSNGNIRYKGYFRDDKPTGVFKYFYEDNDSLRILAMYSDNGSVAHVHEYYSSGVLASTGKYVNEKKDSVWKIYDDLQRLEEKDQYKNGKKNGKCMTFYANGNVLESKTWHNDVENGKWRQFFDNGDLKLEGTYVNGKLEGPATFYLPGGNVTISGTYHNDVKDGKWIYYNDAGHPIDTVVFHDGKPLPQYRSKFIFTQSQLDSMKQRNLQYEQRQPKQVGEDEDDYGN